MTKAEATKLLKGFRNSTIFIDGVHVANVAWNNDPWLVIENEETFNEAKADGFIPITTYHTREELLRAIFNPKYSK